ncbi:MAG: thioredoxin domain-containing protein [Candidatus Sumerlaeia bacterium]|nr:thioredoxin domain-containing protein [Candidatus Sumerlaeia bacterium]
MTQPTSPAAPRRNRLAKEASLYLRQHGENPVDWYPWGPEALGRARAEDKPIFLSIGYSACHWCHVMEHESFTDPRIAELMNALFVNIKVDREERPDLDQIYMQATTLMNDGHGGWPMSVFLTPELKPFFTGTYFPPEDRYGRPGFPTVLQAIADAWRSRRESLLDSAEKVTEAIAQATRLRTKTPVALSAGVVAKGAAAFESRFDARHGGTMGAPKFPPSQSVFLLLRCAERSGQERFREMALFTLDKMAAGGMYDQLGGGFHRYSVDEKWLVPHFEKMLYDNALLLRAYAEGYAASGREGFARVAREIVDYVNREMTHPDGPFYSTQDADSEGEEGKFFAWSAAELREALGDDDAEFAARAYGVTAAGNFEHGTSVLFRNYGIEDLAKQTGTTPEAAAARVEAVRAKLFAVREQRVKPLRDEKVLTAWNGLMIAGLAAAERLVGLEGRAARLAARAADFLLANVVGADGRAKAVWYAGEARLDGYLDCHAFLAWGLLELAAASGEVRYVADAERIAGAMRRHFADPEGGYFFTAADHEQLIVRSQDAMDNATPSGNAIAAMVHRLLYEWTGAAEHREAAQSTLAAFSAVAERFPSAFPMMLTVADRCIEAPESVVVVGGGPGAKSLLEGALRPWRPNRLVVARAAEEPDGAPSLVAGKTAADGKAAAYYCHDFVCERPRTA